MSLSKTDLAHLIALAAGKLKFLPAASKERAELVELIKRLTDELIKGA